MLKNKDPKIYNLIKREEKRQREVLEMIPSENYASKEVLEALGTVFVNKYSEGYPKKRYYQGNEVVDDVEILAEERAKKLFGVPYANVQPYSGSPANSAVYFALLTPFKDKIMGLSLAYGGHLTHGSPVSFSGTYFPVVSYTFGKDGYLDYQEIEKVALKEKPKVIVCGFTAYPRIVDFKRFGEIADKVGALTGSPTYLLVDLSHITGLVIAGAHPSPVLYSDIIMTTTHKTLRGPRGAMLLVTEKGLKKDPDLPSKLDKAVFPGLQGGPHDNQTAAIAVALSEASKPAFKTYGKQIVKNAKKLAEELKKHGFDLVSGGTDNHLLLIDLSNKNVNGAIGAFALEVAGIVVNKNAVPNDKMPPFYPSGIRLGTPAITTRGLKEKEMVKIADFINRAINQVADYQLPNDKEERAKFWKKAKAEILKNKNLIKISKEVKILTSKFPI